MKDSNVQTSDGWDIYYLSKAWALPGTATVESTDTVPRIAGMKISLFIMGPNQISDAICLLANAGWVSWSCGGVTYTRPVPVCAPRPSAPRSGVLRRLLLSNDWSPKGISEKIFQRECWKSVLTFDSERKCIIFMQCFSWQSTLQFNGFPLTDFLVILLMCWNTHTHTFTKTNLTLKIFKCH